MHYRISKRQKKHTKLFNGLFTLKFVITRCLITALKLILLLMARQVLTHKRAEAQISLLARLESQNFINEFLGIISHNLKTPITSIKGNIQLIGQKLKRGLPMDPAHPEETKKTITEIQGLLANTDQQITRLTHLVNSLLESSRIRTNTMGLLYEPCALNALLHEVVQETRELPANRILHLELPAETVVFVMADASHIKLALTHYIMNAHKYSPVDHPIHLSLEADEHTARIQVRDEGPGIPESTLPHIWERFYCAPGIETLNGSEVGLGLGLHICKTIIEQHHGRVGVTSVPGAGSTFWFTLPLLHIKGHL